MLNSPSLYEKAVQRYVFLFKQPNKLDFLCRFLAEDYNFKYICRQLSRIFEQETVKTHD